MFVAFFNDISTIFIIEKVV